MLEAEKSSKLSKQKEPECSRPPRSKQAGTELLLSSHTEAFTAALSEVKDSAYSVYEMFAQWESVRVRMFTENQRKIPIYDSQKSPTELNGKLPSFIYISVISSTESGDALILQTNHPCRLFLQEKFNRIRWSKVGSP